MATQFNGYGMPSVDFSPLGELGNVYRQNKNEATLANLGQALSSGQIDYRGAAGMAAQAGRPDLSLALLKQAETLRREAKTDAEKADFTRQFGRLLGAGGGEDLGAVAPPTAPSGAPRAETPMPSTPVAAAPGSPNMRVASAFGDVQNAIGSGIMDPQGANGQNIPINAQPTQGAIPQQIAQAAPPAPRMQPPLGSGPQPSPSTNPIQNNIPALVALASHPGADAGQRETAKVLLQEAIKRPDNLREYDFYVKQTRANGGQPLPVLDYFMQKAAAGTQGRAQTAFDVEIDKKAADRFGKYIENADVAQKNLTDINNMREIGRRVGSQGATAQIKEALGPYAEALGIDVTNLSDIQAYSSIIQRIAPRMRAPGSGSTSNIEFEGFIKSLPTLSQNPQAREMTLDTMQSLAQYDLALGNIASRVVTREITSAQAEKERRALPDPMTGFREWRKANPGVFGAAVKEGAAAPSAQGAPARSAIEQEMKRRGLIP